MDEKNLRLLQITLDVIAIFLFIALLIFGAKEIKAVKLAASNPCKLCQDKTGALCFKQAPVIIEEDDIKFNIGDANKILQ